MAGEMVVSTSANGFSTFTLPDGKVIDLSRKVRLTTAADTFRGPGVLVEGVLSGPIDAEVTRGPLTFILRFHGGATAGWIPSLGDVLENC